MDDNDKEPFAILQVDLFQHASSELLTRRLTDKKFGAIVVKVSGDRLHVAAPSRESAYDIAVFLSRPGGLSTASVKDFSLIGGMVLN